MSKLRIKKHCMLEEQYNIKFIHPLYKKTVLSYGVNPLTNEWMFWWSSSAGRLVNMYTSTKPEINKMITNVKKQHKESEEFILNILDPVKEF